MKHKIKVLIKTKQKDALHLMCFSLTKSWQCAVNWSEWSWFPIQNQIQYTYKFIVYEIWWNKVETIQYPVTVLRYSHCVTSPSVLGNNITVVHNLFYFANFVCCFPDTSTGECQCYNSDLSACGVAALLCLARYGSGSHLSSTVMYIYRDIVSVQTILYCE